MNRQILIQRLVDHELDPTNRRELIERLPAEDPSWRKIALAFVEKQLLDETIGQLSHSHCQIDDPQAGPDATTDDALPAVTSGSPSTAFEAMNGSDQSNPGLPDRNPGHAVANHDVSSNKHQTKKEHFSQNDFNRSSVSMAWTVAVAVGFLIVGFTTGHFQGRHQEFVSGQKNGPLEPGFDEIKRDRALASSDDLTDALARCSTPIPDQFRRDLLSAGFVLNEDQEMEEVPLPFGGTIEMPVRKFEIQYLGPSAYQ